MKRQTDAHVRQKISTSERRICNMLGVARSTMTCQSEMNYAKLIESSRRNDFQAADGTVREKL